MFSWRDKMAPCCKMWRRQFLNSSVATNHVANRIRLLELLSRYPRVWFFLIFGHFCDGINHSPQVFLFQHCNLCLFPSFHRYFISGSPLSLSLSLSLSPHIHTHTHKHTHIYIYIYIYIFITQVVLFQSFALSCNLLFYFPSGTFNHL